MGIPTVATGVTHRERGPRAFPPTSAPRTRLTVLGSHEQEDKKLGPESKSALLVDDSNAWAEALAEALSREGFKVTCVNDGLAGVERLRAAPPDILITDYFLPNLDGGKLCQLAKQVAPANPPMTIILTGGADRNLSRGPSRYADAVIAKNTIDVVIGDLLAAIRQLSDNGPTSSLAESVIGHERLEPRALSAKLYTLKQHLDALHEGIGDAVIGVDSNLRIYFVNTTAAEILGQREEDLIARDVARVLGVPIDAPLITQIQGALQGNRAPRPHLTVKLAEHTLRTSVATLSSPTGDRSALLIATDVSDLVAADAERKSLLEQLHVADKMRSLGQMTAGIAHEINNPLAALVPNIQQLRDRFQELNEAPTQNSASPVARSISELLDDCGAACQQIRSVVGEMLRFAHPEEQKGRRVSIPDLVDDALSLLSREVRFSARLERDYQPTPDLVVDRGMLSQAILNVAINANQALTTSDVKDKWIRVTTRMFEGGIAIDVSNSGPPIPDEAKQEIFEPFYTTKSPGDGVGLGLSIAYETVRRHGGYISVVDDSPTTFRIWLPKDTGKTLVSSRPPRSPAPPQSPPEVLVVDDELLVRKSLRRVLDSVASVTLASGGQDAIELMARQEFEVILCDLLMPRITGMQLYQSVLESNPELASRFVFLTGGTSDVKAREFLKTVSNPRAFKPIDSEQLVELVERSAVRSRASRSIKGSIPA